jgi:hypothetical protein
MARNTATRGRPGVAEDHHYLDLAGLLTQLGAIG